MITAKLLLMILAIICFLFAAVGIQPPRNGNLIAAGLACWALATVISS
jgi:hypothetical protein